MRSGRQVHECEERSIELRRCKHRQGVVASLLAPVVVFVVSVLALLASSDAGPNAINTTLLTLRLVSLFAAHAHFYAANCMSDKVAAMGILANVHSCAEAEALRDEVLAKFYDDAEGGESVLGAKRRAEMPRLSVARCPTPNFCAKRRQCQLCRRF